MAMCELTRLVQIAPAITSVVALFGVGVACVQLYFNRANQRETTAKAIFRDYLKLAFENPDLAAGNYQSLSLERQQKYEWFVGYFLWGAEEILDYAKKDKLWKLNLEINAKRHREYFKNNKEFREVEINGYKPNVQALIERVIQQGNKD
jgi:hypothetical protein